MQDPEAKYKRISKWMGRCMLVVAGLIDFIQLILAIFVIGIAGLDSGISVAADVLFITWFWILGVTFAKKPGRLAAMGIQAIVGLIPALDAVMPELTIAVWYTLKSVREEDGGAIMEPTPA